MASLQNMLRSHAGLELPLEVCLDIVEYAIEDDPKSAGTLMQLSKTFHTLLKTYEKSITKTLSSNDSRLKHVNAEQSTALASCISPGGATVTIFTYEWYMEMRFRHSVVELLINHDITAMDDALTNDWPSLDLTASELEPRVAEFKRRSFCLMYQLVDSIAGLTEKEELQAQRACFLRCLTATELAMLGCIVEIMGQGYLYFTKSLVLNSFCKTIVDPRQRSVPLSLMDMHNIPSPMPPLEWDELLSGQGWITEYACVFEDRVLRSGPYFAWAYLTSSKNHKQHSDDWVDLELQQGISDLHAFEGGHITSCASLQSVVWRTFCTKSQCSSANGWDKARNMVEVEMMKYTVKQACDETWVPMYCRHDSGAKHGLF